MKATYCSSVLYSLLLLIAPSDLNLMGQNMPPEDSRMAGSIGAVTIDGTIYNQFSIRPGFTFGKIGIGLDLYLYLSADGEILLDEYDFSSPKNVWQTVADKIYYLRYGRPSDPLYLRVGALEEVTLGQGILVQNYNNVMNYPAIRQVGINATLPVGRGSLELFASDIKKTPGALGGRFALPLVGPVSIGFSFVTDIDQNVGLKDLDDDGYPDIVDDFPDESRWHLDSDGDGLADNHQGEIDLDGDGYPDQEDAVVELWTQIFQQMGQDTTAIAAWANSHPFDPDINRKPEPFKIGNRRDPITGISIDLYYPLIREAIVELAVYAQIARLQGSYIEPYSEKERSLGTGIVPVGAAFRFGPVQLTAELRQSSRGFSFAYWDRSYDLNRVVFSEGFSHPTTKESLLYRYGKQSGIYSQIGAQLLNLANFKLGYQSMVGEVWQESIDGESLWGYEENNNNSLTSVIQLNADLVPRLKVARGYYQQLNARNPFDFEPSETAVTGYQIGLEMGEGLTLLYNYRVSYRDVNGDGRIRGSSERIVTTQIETQIVF